MSRTEEIALSRIGAIPVEDPPKQVETSVIQDVVKDNRRGGDIHKFSYPSTVTLPDAKPVVTGNDGARWTPPSLIDWRTSEHVKAIEIQDRMMDVQDALDKAEREAKLAKLKRDGGAE